MLDVVQLIDARIGREIGDENGNNNRNIRTPISIIVD